MEGGSWGLVGRKTLDFCFVSLVDVAMICGLMHLNWAFGII